MKYKLEKLADEQQRTSEENKYCLSGNSKYIKENILKLFKKSNISELRVYEMQLLEEIEVTFEANLDQIDKLKKLLKKVK